MVTSAADQAAKGGGWVVSVQEPAGTEEETEEEKEAE